MHPNTQTVMDRLDFSRFDVIDHPVKEKVIEDIREIVSGKLARYDLTEGRPRRPRKNGDSMDPIDRATRVVQGMLAWNSSDAAMRNYHLGLPAPMFNNALELIKDTADHYRQ